MLIFISRSGNPFPIKQELAFLSINAKYRYSSSNQNLYGHYFDSENILVREDLIKIRERVASLQTDVLSVDQLINRNHKSLFTFEMESILKRVKVFGELDQENEDLESKTLLDGVAEIFPLIQRENGVITILADDFVPVIEKFAEKISIDLISMKSPDKENGFTKGKVLKTIVNKSHKRDFLIQQRDERKIPISQTTAVGYESNDSLMIQEAGIGIGFHAKPELKQEILNWIDFHSILSLLFLFDLRD